MKCFVALALCLQLWPSAEAQNLSCGHTMDPAEIAVLLDSTHSIKEENWPVMKQFMKDVADRVNYGPNETRMGGIQWSRKSWEMMPLDQFPTKQSLFDALDGIPFRRGGGQLHKALDLLVDQTLSRNVSRDVARIGILVIDEQSHQPELTQAASQRVRASGIKMIVIGVERRRFDFNELVGIAGNESHVLVVDSIMDLDTPEFLDELMDLICSDAILQTAASLAGTMETPVATTIGQCRPHACPYSNQWTAPAGWTGGQPDFYLSFEDTGDMCFHNGAHLAPGKVGNGLSTDNLLKQYVELGNVSCIACLARPNTCGVAGATMSVWIKVLPSSSPNHGILSSREERMGGGFDIVTYSWMRYRVVSSDSWDRIDSIATPVGNWLHVVIVYDGPKQKLSVYNNGMEESTGYTNFPGPHPDVQGNMVIGRMYTVEGQADEVYSSLQVDELLFWNKALTEMEVQELYMSYF